MTAGQFATSRFNNNYDVTIAKILKLLVAIATKTRAEMLVAITLLGLTGLSSGTDNDKPTGKDLIEKARMVSDIRAEGAPPFRMEGTFRITPKKGGKEIEGSYTEIWISRSKWRREVQTSSFHRVQVGAPGKTWLADSGTDRPDAALYEPLTLIFSNQPPEMHRVSQRELDSTQANCVESKSDRSLKKRSTGIFGISLSLLELAIMALVFTLREHLTTLRASTAISCGLRTAAGWELITTR